MSGCDHLLRLRRGAAMEVVKGLRKQGKARVARKCKGCGWWHVWPR